MMNWRYSMAMVRISRAVELLAWKMLEVGYERENPSRSDPHRGTRACVQDRHRQRGEEELLQSADDVADVGCDDASRPNGRLLGRGTLCRRPGFHGRAGYAEILWTQGREYRDQARQY